MPHTKAYMDSWREAHRQHNRDYMAQYRREHPDYMRKYRATNKTRLTESQRQYRRANPENHRHDENRRRARVARKRGIAHRCPVA